MARRLALPPGLEAKGKRLWRAVLTLRPAPGPGEVILIEEACRIADRLDRLADSITGEDFLTLIEGEVDDENVREYRIVVNGALSEARLQAQTLRQVLTTLGLEQSVDPGVPVPTQTKGDPGDQLARARDSRRGTTTEAV